jgi:hypothetical protein
VGIGRGQRGVPRRASVLENVPYHSHKEEEVTEERTIEKTEAESQTTVSDESARHVHPSRKRAGTGDLISQVRMNS